MKVIGPSAECAQQPPEQDAINHERRRCDAKASQQEDAHRLDGIGQVSHFENAGESWDLRVMAPLGLGKYLAYKGSITVNGVSLTVNRVVDSAQGCEAHINLIPHTVENTALATLKAGSAVNLEIDTIARYVERMMNAPAPK